MRSRADRTACHGAKQRGSSLLASTIYENVSKEAVMSTWPGKARPL